MRHGKHWLLICVFLGAGVAACGGDGGGTSKGPGVSTDDGDDGGSELVCIDRDHDGFSLNCRGDGPLDCDDEDPDVTDECTRCRVVNDNCPCEVGTEPEFCKPPDIEADGGVFSCKEGTRYCRKGVWSKCEQAGNYVFVPNE